MTAILPTGHPVPHINDPDADWDELSTADMELIEREAVGRAEAKLTSTIWWGDVLEGQNTVTANLPHLLSLCATRALANRPGATRSNEILNFGIADRVTDFMTIARDRALDEARAEATEALERGELA
jgi:hypothetical protein